MTPADKLLAILAYSPRKFLELRKLTGLSASGLRYHLQALRKNNEIHATGPDNSLTYRHGPAPDATRPDDPFDRPGGVNITHLGNGWRRVTFGRDWRAGKGLSGRVPLCGIQSRMSMTVMAV